MYKSRNLHLTDVALCPVYSFSSPGFTTQKTVHAQAVGTLSTYNDVYYLVGHTLGSKSYPTCERYLQDRQSVNVALPRPMQFAGSCSFASQSLENAWENKNLTYIPKTWIDHRCNTSNEIMRPRSTYGTVRTASPFCDDNTQRLATVII